MAKTYAFRYCVKNLRTKSIMHGTVTARAHIYHAAKIKATKLIKERIDVVANDVWVEDVYEY